MVYDAFGQALASRSVAGHWSYKTYDRAGRLAYEIDAMGYVSGYARDAFGAKSLSSRATPARRRWA